MQLEDLSPEEIAYIERRDGKMGWVAPRQALTVLRLRAGLTYGAVARLIGVKDTAILEMENGRRRCMRQLLDFWSDFK